MELEVTWNRVVKVWWAFFWRNLLAILASAIVGGILGGILGLILGMLGLPVTVIRYIAFPLGAALGIFFSLIPIRVILNKNFGEFRIVLLKN